MEGAESKVDLTLAALADKTRREVVELLRETPRRPSDIADALSLSRPALSRHLRVLRQAGLVSEEVQVDDARARLLHLRRQPFEELQSWVSDVTALWEDQLAAFKRHAERGPKRSKR